MGTLNNGPFGHINGRVGNLVSYTLKGKNVIRTAGKNAKPPTLAKLANYQRMKVTNAFLKPTLALLNLGFAKAVEDTDRSAYNEAVSYHKKHALQGVYPNISMDYSKAMLSKGNLPPAVSPALNILSNGIEFTWEMPGNIAPQCLNNRAMLLVFFPEGVNATRIPRAAIELSGARRHECRDFMALTAAELGKPFEAYIAFIADDRLNVSDSVWVGA
ncbi:MAG TPA: DUF6266 family protein [Pedobacter sp.]|uniref:DUF6266 family protein n=1 Tax=Pedobacter sp. TaxID=1411316 RepID=UPI002C275BD5|nr:DUF6266 family protein [Pedobacter sp.]HMI02180.1 DUF6266 family protein [Pedobacter sp.]